MLYIILILRVILFSKEYSRLVLLNRNNNKIVFFSYNFADNTLCYINNLQTIFYIYILSTVLFIIILSSKKCSS